MRSFLLTKIGILFVLTFLLGSTDIAAQEEGSAEVYTMADTVRANELILEIHRLVMNRAYDEVLIKSDSAKAIYTALLGDAGHSGISDAWYAIGYVKFRQWKTAEALAAFLEAVRVTKILVGAQHNRVSVIYNNIASCYRDLEEYMTALEYLGMSVSILEYQNKHFSPDMAGVYNSMSRVAFLQGLLRESALYAEKAIRICERIGAKQSLTMSFALVNLANCYSVNEDYAKAIPLHEKSMEITASRTGQKHEDYALILNNIGICYQGLFEYEKAIEYHQNAITIRDSLQNNSRDRIQSYNNISNVLTRLGDYTASLNYLNKALALCEEDTTIQKFYKASILTNIGSYNVSLKNYRAAEISTRAAIALKSTIFGKSHPDLVTPINNLGDIYVYLGKFDSATLYYNEALEILNSYQSNDSPVLISAKLQTLAKKGILKNAQYQNTQILSYLTESAVCFRSAFTGLNQLSKTVSSASKSPLAAAAAEISSNAIATNQLLFALTDSIHYLHESFDYAERSKAYLLYEAMQEADALHIAGIPDSLLVQEYDLRVEIAYFDKRKQEKLSSGISETDSTVLAIGSKLFDLKRTHETLIQRFESDYPQYYQAKYGLKTASIEEVQQSLSHQQTMLQYVLGDSSIFLFLVQKNHLEVQEIKKDFPLERWVDSLTRHGIYGYHTLPITQKTPSLEAKTIHNYTHAAQALYEKLIAPVKTKLSPELIIIPDGVLGYIPFETLLTKAPGRKGNFASYPFLLNEHQISYCYSATLLREMREKHHRKKSQKTVLALAPFFRGDLNTLNARVDTTELFALRDSLGTLPASGDEAALISKIWNGMPIYGAAASLDTFQTLTDQYQILHLSTHGKADDRVGDYAYLALGAANNPQDYDKLYARDLYNLELNAELVVLSACETGIGKLRRGEGIVSLARAFAYAGAKSIVTSLWKVDDSKTKDLLVDFYQHLKSGKTKDAALQQAKLDFLAKNRAGGGDAMHPFFWAGFIAIGDMGAVKP